MDKIQIRGARVNNLKDVSLDIALNKITCIAGPSGSGKSSLAFHTLFTESKRRFLNSFPTYLKFFSDRPAPVDVDEISPVLPVFGLPQINPVVGTRSVASDVMNLTAQGQTLFYNYGKQLCSVHKEELVCKSFEQILLDKVEKLDPNEIVTILISKSDFLNHLGSLPFPSRSYCVEGGIKDFCEEDLWWELIRFKVKGIGSLKKKLSDIPIEKLNLSIYWKDAGISPLNLKSTPSCPICGEEGIEYKTINYFTPYNPLGACSSCSGFGAHLEYDEAKLYDLELSVKEGGALLLKNKRFDGLQKDFEKDLKLVGIDILKPIKKLPKKFFKFLFEGGDHFCGYNQLFTYLESKRYKANVRIFIRSLQKEVQCEICHSSRITKEVHNFFLPDTNLSIKDFLVKTIEELYEIFWAIDLKKASSDYKKQVDVIKDLLKVAVGLGLGHIQVNRKTRTLSAGEYQRLLLLKYIAYEGTGSLFIFDEPSLGLSVEESKKLLSGFKKLVKQNNTVIVVDHSIFFQKQADELICMGPGAGKFGGKVIYQGNYSDSPTAKEKIKVVRKRHFDFSGNEKIKAKNISIYNKKYLDLSIVKNSLTWAHGKSGTGKTSVLINCFAQELLKINQKDVLKVAKGDCDLFGDTSFEDIIVVNSNLNRFNSRSTVGSITELFSIVRKHFLKTPAAKSMGLKDGHLSFNSELGQCPKCKGTGKQVIEMQFLEDVVFTCEDCNGTRIKNIYSSLTDGKRTVHEAYSMPMSMLFDDLKMTPKFQRIWEYVKLLKLDYLSLDRTLSSLSGGEKQRIFLLSKLTKNITNSLLIFENISFGLSQKELVDLGYFFQELTQSMNTLIVIDQHPIFKDICPHSINFEDKLK